MLIKTYQQLDPQIRDAVKTFISTAVAREHLDQSWNVVAPSMKAGYTKAQWQKANDLPVVPYPGVDPKHVQYYLDYASTKEILVEVGLAGKPGVSTRPVTFQLGLEPGAATATGWSTTGCRAGRRRSRRASSALSRARSPGRRARARSALRAAARTGGA